MSHQIEFISLEQLVSENHEYRKFKKIFNLSKVKNQLKKLNKDNYGYGLERLFFCLLLQFMEDLSDRETEIFLRENNSAKWFCQFSLKEKTPDHSVFCRARERIGTSKLSKIFRKIKEQLVEKGLMSECFTFVDTTHLVAKFDLWKERDDLIKKKQEELNEKQQQIANKEKQQKLNNKNISKVARDPEAKIGCKRKNKYWYGYKENVSVDMQSGLINKISIMPANIPDGEGLKNVCPSQGLVFADKGYCSKKCEKVAKIAGAELRAIKKNNRKDKNKDLDKYIAKHRSPFERVFSQRSKWIRYLGIVKNQFSSFMFALQFNLKRLVNLGWIETYF